VIKYSGIHAFHTSFIGCSMPKFPMSEVNKN